MRSKTSFPSNRWTILILLLLVQALSSLAVSQAISPALLQDLTFKSTANQTVVVIKANRTFDYTSYYPNPRLFILDIPAAQSRLQQNSIAIKGSLVDYATITQIGEGQGYLVRIEFNLNQPIQYALHNDGSNLRINFSSIGLAEVNQANDTPSGEQKSTQLQSGSEELKEIVAKALTEEEPARIFRSILGWHFGVYVPSTTESGNC